MSVDPARFELATFSMPLRIQVSLDGLEATHNRIRGNEQSFNRAVRAINLLVTV